MLTLDALQDCLEGAVPGAVATCASDGTPNVSFVSQVHLADSSHVALSFQFFTKTRENVLATGRATVLVAHPAAGAEYRLFLEYARTEHAGPLFEKMKAKLAGIASHTGMSGIFRLRGADVYRVVAIEEVPSRASPASVRQPSLLPALRACITRLDAARDLSTLLDETLVGLDAQFGVDHAMVLMLDRAGRCLYTVATKGYARSGVGSEIPLGCGVIGVAAEQQTPIRIGHPAAEYVYGQAVHDSMVKAGRTAELETAIPFPGLADPGSQLAVPICARGRLQGVLYLESPRELTFDQRLEDAMVVLAAHVGGECALFQASAEVQSAPPADADTLQQPVGPPCVVRHYAEDDSIFVADDYLIKGVAGAILAKLLREHLDTGRSDFTNKELRLDPALRLPDVTDNLEARLILLERRLVERRAPVRLVKTARGRFRLRVDRPVTLTRLPADRSATHVIGDRQDEAGAGTHKGRSR